MGTAVAHFPLRQLGFLVISADCCRQWRIQEFVTGAIHLLLIPSTPSQGPPLSLPLEVGPLKSLWGLKSAISSPSGVWGGAPSEIEFGAFLY